MTAILNLEAYPIRNMISNPNFGQYSVLYSTKSLKQNLDANPGESMGNNQKMEWKEFDPNCVESRINISTNVGKNDKVESGKNVLNIPSRREQSTDVNNGINVLNMYCRNEGFETTKRE